MFVLPIRTERQAMQEKNGTKGTSAEHKRKNGGEMDREVVLLPQPRLMKEKNGVYLADYRASIVMDTSCEKNVFLYARMLQESLQTYAGFSMSILRGKPRKGDIFLRIRPSFLEDGQHSEKYSLSICETGVVINGDTEERLLNGIQTLRQIIAQRGSVLPCMEVEDEPVIPNRGFYHDATRGRVPRLDELKKLADIMCTYKMNQLQLYVEHTYLFRELSEMWRDETPLTAEEIMELDEYCMERHIELIPSLSSFGHLYKLLRTKQFEPYCELEGASDMPYSFRDRMAHHTVNVYNRDAIKLIKRMIEEYMGLFHSRYFNICTDETFDLCRGRSRYMTKERDVEDIYTDYVRELSEFVIEKGKIPMFWGDILSHCPDKIKDLPSQNICLNWGYAADQREDESRNIAKTGVVQYICPGVGGWNEWVNLFQNSYENIRRMCSYAVKYNAAGVLNTDWGDFGHINQPEFSRPGMIYGAALSWNPKELSFAELNRRISILEFGDSTGEMMEVLSQIPGHQSFGWREAVLYYEMGILGKSEEDRRVIFFSGSPDRAGEYNESLAQIRIKLQNIFSAADPDRRYLLRKYLIGIDAIMIWNRVKTALASSIYQVGVPMEDPWTLAKDLEEWFMQYKEEWRKVSKEGDLSRIGAIIFWYADQLRTDGKERKQEGKG